MDESPKPGDAKPAAPQENAAKTENDQVDAIAERVIAAFTKINRANRKADAAENERNHRREKRRFKVELFEIFLIAVYAFFTILEWRTFNSERKTMEGEFNASQTNAVQQLHVFQRQLDEMEKTRESDERAWVAASDTTAVINGNSVYFRVNYINTGKTPAVNCESVMGWGTLLTRLPNQDGKPTPPMNCQLMPPSGTGNVNTASIPITTQEVTDIENGKLRFYIFGTIWYDDIFRQHHWSQFCYQVIPGLEANSLQYTTMPFHNSCDDAQTNQTN